MKITSSWHIEDGNVELLRATSNERPTPTIRNTSLHRALAQLASRTHCTIGRRNGDGVVSWYSFRVLEREDMAMRAIPPFVSITEHGRRVFAACQRDVRRSRPMEVKTA